MGEGWEGDLVVVHALEAGAVVAGAVAAGAGTIVGRKRRVDDQEGTEAALVGTSHALRRDRKKIPRRLPDN